MNEVIENPEEDTQSPIKTTTNMASDSKFIRKSERARLKSEDDKLTINSKIKKRYDFGLQNNNLKKEQSVIKLDSVSDNSVSEISVMDFKAPSLKYTNF